MLNTERHKRARKEGGIAKLEHKPIKDNPYSRLGKLGQTYASLWDAGWNETDRNIDQKWSG